MTAGKKDKQPYKDLASALLDEGKTIRIEASGYSMYPSIKAGNIIHIEKISDRDDICPGDIIAWQRESDMVVHRIVHRYMHEDKYFFITRGDSSLQSDKPVSFSQVAGKVIAIEKNGRKVLPANKVLIREYRYLFNQKRVWLLVRIRALLRRLGIKPRP